MTNRINYVVACWGKRGQEGPEYIKTHINLLNKLENHIAQVTLVSPPYIDGLSLHKKFETLLSELDGTTLENGTPIVVLGRASNDNISYGSFSDAYGLYRQQFDYYIWMEDDYIPARPNFDTILVDILEEKQCHYLCMLVSTSCCKDNIPHAGVTVGISKSSALEIIWEKYGSLLSTDFEDKHWLNQMNFSYPYHYCDLKIDDCSDTYAVPFWNGPKNELLHFVQRDHYLLVPHQHFAAVKYDD